VYILYIDGSGSVRNPAETHIILAGIAVFERQIFHLIKEFDKFVHDLDVGHGDGIELHGNAILRGSERPWKGLHSTQRKQILEDALALLTRSHRSVCAFAVVLEKHLVAPHDPMEYAFEEICNRFNLYLTRLYNRKNEKQRGLIVMDEDHYERTLQGLARDFRSRGTRWGRLQNLAEVPLFVDSKASRLIQIADLVAYAVWRRYDYRDTRYFDRIVARFDREGGVIHGLVHCRRQGLDCHCPACMSRQAGRQLQLWTQSD
jgi:hypothetical protein